MNILKKAQYGTLLLGISSLSFANNVAINNSSNHTIGIQYQKAYNEKIHKGNVITSNTFEAILKPHSVLNLTVNPVTYNNTNANAGIIIKAVKQQLTGKWNTLPDDITAYNSHPGCWAKTDSKHSDNTISFSYNHLSSKLKCSTTTAI